VAQAAVDAAANLGIETIVAFTESGSTARLLSKYRPAARIVAFTPVPATRRVMSLYRGVTAYPFERRDYTDLMIAAAEKFLEKEGVCSRGEIVVMVAGIPPNRQASTNLLKVHMIGERDRGVPSQRDARTSPEGGG
jgi:pyruvate kinase